MCGADNTTLLAVAMSTGLNTSSHNMEAFQNKRRCKSKLGRKDGAQHRFSRSADCAPPGRKRGPQTLRAFKAIACAKSTFVQTKL